MEEVVMMTEIMAVVDITVIRMIEGIGIMIIIMHGSGVGMIMIVIMMGDIVQTIIIMAGEEVIIIMDGGMQVDGIVIIVIEIIVSVQGKMYQWQSLL